MEASGPQNDLCRKEKSVINASDLDDLIARRRSARKTYFRCKRQEMRNDKVIAAADRQATKLADAEWQNAESELWRHRSPFDAD